MASKKTKKKTACKCASNKKQRFYVHYVTSSRLEGHLNSLHENKHSSIQVFPPIKASTGKDPVWTIISRGP